MQSAHCSKPGCLGMILTGQRSGEKALGFYKTQDLSHSGHWPKQNTNRLPPHRGNHFPLGEAQCRSGFWNECRIHLGKRPTANQNLTGNLCSVDGAGG